MLTSIEICAGAGGQALGLEQAGFRHLAVVENDPAAAQTLRINRDNEFVRSHDRWPVEETDVRNYLPDIEPGRLDLLAGGVPCPPFSVAGVQKGHEDERDLFPRALELVEHAKPKAVLLENVPGLSQKRFTSYRSSIIERLYGSGYTTWWKKVTSAEFGVAQLRPRFILIALKHEYAAEFHWPTGSESYVSVGEALYSQMAARGWPGARAWAARANGVGPTLVGGSKLHGGPDLGPSRAREAWRKLGVRGSSLAEEAPAKDFPIDEMPRLTVQMAATLQGFPDDWVFHGGKTQAYRQVGNAFPPPVARAMGVSIRNALNGPATLRDPAEARGQDVIVLS